MSPARTSLTACVAVLGTLLALPAAAAEYAIDGTHSFTTFRVNHLGIGTAWGRFNDISGTFVLDEKNPAASSVEVAIAAESVDTGNERRDKHLRSPDFFDAKQFPALEFRSTRVKPIAAGALEVTGVLRIHGVTKEITIRADLVGSGKDPWGNERAGYETEFTIQRSDFGMSYMVPGLGDDVKVYLAFEGIRQ